MSEMVFECGGVRHELKTATRIKSSQPKLRNSERRAYLRNRERTGQRRECAQTLDRLGQHLDGIIHVSLSIVLTKTEPDRSAGNLIVNAERTNHWRRLE